MEPEERTLLLTGKKYTLWAFWMRGRLLEKGLGVICSEDEKDSRLTAEKGAEAFYLLLSSMSEFTLSRVLTATRARDVWVILRKLDASKHARTALAYENEVDQQRYRDGTSIEDHFNEFWTTGYSVPRCWRNHVRCQCCTCNVAGLQQLSNLQGNYYYFSSEYQVRRTYPWWDWIKNDDRGT